MRINNNLMAMNTQRQLTVNQSNTAKSIEKLSSGSRINRSADDAAGLTISEKMRRQVRGLNMASRNAQDGISLIQTAEGALNETHAILQRMGELAVQGSNGTLDEAEDSTAIDAEMKQLSSEIDRIATTTKFNGKTLLNSGFATTGVTLQIGSNQTETMTFTIESMNTAGLSISAVSVATVTGSQTAITTIDDAIKKVSTLRTKLGAVQNRLEHTTVNLDTAAENLQSAESRIRDVDMAKEMMTFTKNNILNQAATAMLAQANTLPQTVLQLLK